MLTIASTIHATSAGRSSPTASRRPPSGPGYAAAAWRRARVLSANALVSMSVPVGPWRLSPSPKLGCVAARSQTIPFRSAAGSMRASAMATDRNCGPARCLPPTSKHHPVRGVASGRLCNSAAVAGARRNAVAPSPGRTRLDLGERASAVPATQSASCLGNRGVLRGHGGADGGCGSGEEEVPTPARGCVLLWFRRGSARLLRFVAAPAARALTGRWKGAGCWAAGELSLSPQREATALRYPYRRTERNVEYLPAMGFSWVGLSFSAAMLGPSLLLVPLPPIDGPDPSPAPVPRWVTVSEAIGRATCLVIPPLTRSFQHPINAWFALTATCYGIYVGCGRATSRGAAATRCSRDPGRAFRSRWQCSRC